MPDVPSNSNLVRISSNGSSIISGGSDPDIEEHSNTNPRNRLPPPEDVADELMSDAPPPPNNNSSIDEPPPPPPPPEPMPTEPATNNETSRSRDDDNDHMPWSPIFEDNTEPGIDELKRLETAGESSALDHRHWEKKAFKDLDDPAYVPIASGRIEWTVERFNGTQQKPNKDLLRYSDTVKIGDYQWRIKLYPKGNGTSYVGAYVECVDFVSNKEADKPTDSDSSDDSRPKREVLGNEPLDSPMPTIGKEQLRKPIQVPAQVMIVMYNPQEPRVNFYKKSNHAFTPNDPDRGFARFGPSPIYDLGLRQPDNRQAMLRNDTLGFVAHIRLFKDPTGFLFVRDDYDYRRDFARTGLRPIRVPADSRGYAANLAAAVVAWSLLPMMRTLIYRGSSYDLSKMPLTKALQEFLAHWRRQPSDDDEAPPIPPAPMEQIAKALHWHGSCQSRKSCKDPTHIHASMEFSPNKTKLSVRKPWHPAGRGMQDFDVFQAWEFLLDSLDSEWRGTEMSGALQKIFDPSGFRARLSPKSNNVQSALFHQMMKRGQRVYPMVLQVELPRSIFDEEKRKWRKTDDKISIQQTIKLSKEESGWYSLYGLILHDGGLSSRQYTPVIRPDGKNWYKATTYRATRMTRITEKQAINENESRAYIALYLRSDVHIPRGSAADPFKGMPENDWKVPDHLQEDEKPKPMQCECSKCRQERADAEAEEDRLAAAEAAQDQSPPNEDDGPVAPSTLPAPAQGATVDELQFEGDNPSASSQPVETRTESDNEKQAEPTGVESATDPADASIEESTAMDTDEDDDMEVSQDVHEIDYFASGHYRGTLHKGYMHGNGRRIFSSGDIYEGDFKKDERHGKGNQVYHNGDTYEGSWENDNPHGCGTWTTVSTGNVYEGGFKNGKQHGEFTLKGKRAETLKGCLICYVEERDAVFVPCGHMCACLECARKLEDCPYCHRPINDSIRLFTI